MNYRLNKTVIALVLLLVLVAAGIFAYTLISTPTIVEVVEQENDAALLDAAEESIITAKHQYKEGIHTIVGKTELPTRCHRLVSEPFFVKDDKSEVEVRFNTLLEGGECPQELFEVPFRVTFEAEEDVSITATWNGSPIRLNLVPVGVDEVLDEEMYIKG